MVLSWSASSTLDLNLNYLITIKHQCSLIMSCVVWQWLTKILYHIYHYNYSCSFPYLLLFLKYTPSKPLYTINTNIFLNRFESLQFTNSVQSSNRGCLTEHTHNTDNNAVCNVHFKSYFMCAICKLVHILSNCLTD